MTIEYTHNLLQNRKRPINHKQKSKGAAGNGHPFAAYTIINRKNMSKRLI